MTEPDKIQVQGEVTSPTQRQLFQVQGCSVDKVPLALLIQVTTLEGTPLQYGDFNEGLVLEMFQNVTEVVPVVIEILTDRDALIDIPEDKLTFDVAQVLHGRISWYGTELWVDCIMATRESCMSIQKEREQMRKWKAEVRQI